MRAEVGQAFARISESARRAAPEAKIEGAIVQEQLREGVEVIVGVVRDEQFGPLLMFGSGGVEVERLKDVAFALAPLNAKETDELIDSTWAGRRLRGYRGRPPCDREAVSDALRRLGQLAVDFPEIAEAEINPMRVFERGRGAVALDVRIRLGS